MDSVKKRKGGGGDTGGTQTLKSDSCWWKVTSSHVRSDVTISARMLLNTSKFIVAIVLISAISIECPWSEILCHKHHTKCMSLNSLSTRCMCLRRREKWAANLDGKVEHRARGVFVCQFVDQLAPLRDEHHLFQPRRWVLPQQQQQQQEHVIRDENNLHKTATTQTAAFWKSESARRGSKAWNTASPTARDTVATTSSCGTPAVCSQSPTSDAISANPR